MQKKKIETLKDLRDEKKLVRERLLHLEKAIEDDVAAFKHDLESWSNAGHAVKNLFSSKKNGVMGATAGIAVDAIIKKLLFRKSNFIVRFLVSFILKNLVRNYVSKNSDTIINKTQKAVARAAQRTGLIAE
jgi:hypothetical protein